MSDRANELLGKGVDELPSTVIDGKIFIPLDAIDVMVSGFAIGGLLQQAAGQYSERDGQILARVLQSLKEFSDAVRFKHQEVPDSLEGLDERPGQD